MKPCPPGHTRRRAYVRRTGVSVREACVPLKGVSHNSNTRRVGSHKHCKEGDIPKASYYRKSSLGKADVYVPPSCIRGPSRIGILRRGDLKKYGYGYHLPEQMRRDALTKAMKKYGVLSTWHKLNAIANISASTNPEPASIFKKDAEWVLSIYNKEKETMK